jgi:hypothetical protein
MLAAFATTDSLKKWLQGAALLSVGVIVGASIIVLYYDTQLSSDPIKLYAQVVSKSPLSDPLNGPDNNNGWDVSASCAFQNGAYHASTTKPGQLAECLGEAIQVHANFGYQVQMTTLTGNGGGIIFGALGDASKYRFFVGPGTFYDVFLGGPNKEVIPGSNSGVIHRGTGQQNILTVIVVGTTIYLYINGQFMTKGGTYGSSPVSGKIGVFADEYGKSADNPTPTPTDVFFSNVKVWNL